MRGALGDTRDATGSVRGGRQDSGALPLTFPLDYTGFLQSNLVLVTPLSLYRVCPVSSPQKLLKLKPPWWVF